MNSILEKIGLVGIVPVVVINDAENAEPLGEALLEGGLPCIEVTFRTEAAGAAIERIARKQPEILLGAGTVLTVDQVKSALDRGARYIVAPGLNRKVVEYCTGKSIPVTPGVATPTEVEAAAELGLDVVKFFPAEACGGIAYLKAIAAPYRKMKFIPTGGVDESNLLSYLKFPQVLACGGSWMVKAELISGGRFDEIRKLTVQAVAKMLGFGLKQLAVPAGGSGSLGALAAALGTSLAVGQDSRGRIVLGTQFPDRAIAYLERQGVRIRPETKEMKDGKLAAIDLDLEINGLLVRLAQA